MCKVYIFLIGKLKIQLPQKKKKRKKSERYRNHNLKF